MNNISLKKKNNDGSYDNGEYLFSTIDLYGGDHQQRKLEISPAIGFSQVKHVYFSISLNNFNGKVNFLPSEEDSYLLVNKAYPNVSFYLENENTGIKYYPDKNGLIKITELLIQPIDVVLHIIVEKYSSSNLNEEVIFEDINIEVAGA